MACIDKRYQKSAVKTYNTTTQTVTATLTQLTLLGSTCTDTGCSITPLSNAVEIENSGLYYLAADVTFTPTAAGTEIIQLYNGTTPLPCAIAQVTGTVGAVATAHVETVLCLQSCCACKPQINVKVSGTAAGVNFVSACAVRLA